MAVWFVALVWLVDRSGVAHVLLVQVDLVAVRQIAPQASAAGRAAA